MISYRLANTEKYVIYDEKSSKEFASFVGSLGNTYVLSDAMQFNESEAKDFVRKWESANEGHLYPILVDSINEAMMIKVLPVGQADKLVRFQE